MSNFRLSAATLNIKLVATSLLVIIGLVYLLLVAKIYLGTEMRPTLIIDSYAESEYVELTHQAHLYLPYYAIFIFALPAAIFMLTSYSENLKRFFAVAPFVTIAINIGSLYLIPYVWIGFAIVLWLFGIFLGILLLSLFILTMLDMWAGEIPVNG